MTDTITNYKQAVLDTVLKDLSVDPNVLACWEGGSAATGFVDQYSDIDLCFVAHNPIQETILNVQKSLSAFQVIHTWQMSKSSWGEGIAQRVFVLKDSPKYFFADVGVFDVAYKGLIDSFLEIERHGNAKILFDKLGLLNPKNTDPVRLFEKQKIRAQELTDGFVIFKTLVEKELSRANFIDAMNFYQTGVLRPLIELMGMIYRPFQYDFGMRYVHRTFPIEKQKLIQDLFYVKDSEDLSAKLMMANSEFAEFSKNVLSRTSLM